MTNVVIPTYKARDTLPNLLDSLVAQTTNMFFVTIVQDCDEEDYSDIIKEYQNRGLKIRLITLNENMGPGVARQAGIKFTYDNNIEYIMFADADDLLLPYAVEILSKEMKKTNYDIICSSFYREEHPSLIHPMVATEIPVTWCHGKIYKTSYLMENNIYFPKELRCSEDSCFNAMAVNMTKNKGIVPTFTYYWRDNKNSVTHQDGWAEKDIIQYSQGQVFALFKILDNNEEISYTYITKTLINIYTYMVAQIIKGQEFGDKMDFLKQLKNIDQVQKVINSKEFYKLVQTEVKQYSYIEERKEYISNPLSFEEWLNIYIRRENNE